ncbi:MAG: spore maturation protein A [Clostridia bacterium]|nr:spore maturation protein A [Clostridia bacterium]
MLGKVFGVLCLISLITAILSGNVVSLGGAVLDGARSALDVSLSLCGMMCLWCGILEVLRRAGWIDKLSRLLSPLLRLIFPNAYRTKHGIREISACISANLLGIGNAATPFALSAMEEMQKDNPDKEKAGDEQITFAVLNTASLTLLPANLLALRRAAGSDRPYAILIPVWITSLACTAVALLLTSLPRLLRLPLSGKGARTAAKKRRR